MMGMLDTNLILTSLYSLTGGMMLAGFFPQIWSLIISTGKSKAIAISTYFTWFLSTGISGLYASIVVQDYLIAAISFGACSGNFIIITLTVYNRFFRFPDYELQQEVQDVPA